MASLPRATDDFPRTWDWADGELVGRYREIREVVTADGPRALVELELADTGEVVTVWLSSSVLRRRFADELRLRAQQGASDFEPGELVTITRGTEKRTSANGFAYWPFTVVFASAAKRSAADVLLDHEHDETGGEDDDHVPF